jgi:hypothetical protein
MGNIKTRYNPTENRYIALFKRKYKLEKINFKFFAFKKKMLNTLENHEKQIADLTSKIKPDSQTFSYFLIPVLALLILGEGITSITIMPVFDSQLSGNVPIDD